MSGSSSVVLTIGELTYIYETLHERRTSGVDSKKEKKLCKSVMKTIEEEMFKVEEEGGDKDE